VLLPKEITNASSFCRTTLEKKEEAACRSISIKRPWLALMSISKPKVSGRSLSFENRWMVCCLPSSKTVKLSFVGLGISAPPFFARTVKKTSTNSTLTLIVVCELGLAL
jgi:hypothetical protein